jgi:flagellar basal body-associated protein FliL
LNALVTWSANHKTGKIILLSLQSVVLLGAAAGIFWFARKRGNAKADGDHASNRQSSHELTTVET